MFVCVIPSPHSFHLFLLFLSDVKSQHCLWCQCVSILTDRSVRNKILMLVSDEAKGEYRWQDENQRRERGKIHTTELQGEMQRPKTTLCRGERTFFPLDWVRRSEMHVSPWAFSGSFTVALVLAQEAVEVQEQWSQAASLLVYAFSNGRSSWLKPGLEDFQKLEHTLVVSNSAEVQRLSKNQLPALTWHLN